MDGLGGPTQILATADDPAHALHRKMVVPQLSAKRIRAMESFITETFDRLWTVGVHNGRIEWMSALANRLPMMIVARLIGVPDDDVDQLVKWGCASSSCSTGWSIRISSPRRASPPWSWATTSAIISGRPLPIRG